MSRFFQVIVAPDMNHGAATGTATSNGDILFDWTPFEIPRGTAKLVNMTVVGSVKDGTTANAEDLNIYFAKSIDGVAPTTLGASHAAPTAITSTPSRKNIIGYHLINTTVTTDGGALIGTDVHALNRDNGSTHSSILLQGDVSYKSTAGYQTIWIAGVTFDTKGIWDFDTSIASNEDASANVAADTTGASVVLKTSGTNPQKIFAPGDIAVGSTGGPTMEVVSVDSATQMTVKNISEQIDNGEIINPLNPQRYILGFEY